MLICHEIVKITKEKYHTQEVVKLIKGCLMRLQSKGILLEDPQILLDLPYLIYFKVEHPEKIITNSKKGDQIELVTNHK